MGCFNKFLFLSIFLFFSNHSFAVNSCNDDLEVELRQAWGDSNQVMLSTPKTLLTRLSRRFLYLENADEIKDYLAQINPEELVRYLSDSFITTDPDRAEKILKKQIFFQSKEIGVKRQRIFEEFSQALEIRQNVMSAVQILRAYDAIHKTRFLFQIGPSLIMNYLPTLSIKRNEKDLSAFKPTFFLQEYLELLQTAGTPNDAARLLSAITRAKALEVYIQNTPGLHAGIKYLYEESLKAESGFRPHPEKLKSLVDKYLHLLIFKARQRVSPNTNMAFHDKLLEEQASKSFPMGLTPWEIHHQDAINTANRTARYFRLTGDSGRAVYFDLKRREIELLFQ